MGLISFYDCFFQSTEGPKFVYIVDLNLDQLDLSSAQQKKLISHLQKKPGKAEFLANYVGSTDVTGLVKDLQNAHGECVLKNGERKDSDARVKIKRSAKVTVVGSGPAGLFAALVLAECGANVTLLEQGQPVERRAQDIGGLMVRRLLNPESNFCFGEVLYFLTS